MAMAMSQELEWKELDKLRAKLHQGGRCKRERQLRGNASVSNALKDNSATMSQPTPKGQKPKLRCSLCLYVFQTSNEFISHVQLQHKNESVNKTSTKQMVADSSGVSLKYMCTYCKRSFIDLAELKEHVQNCSRKVVVSTPQSRASILETAAVAKPIISPQVSQRVTGDSVMGVADLQTSPSQTTCETCGKVLKDLFTLKAHRLTHTSERPFVCSWHDCNDSFKTKGSLKRHMRRHTDDRPFVCELCSRSFRESGALTRHLKSRIPCTNKTDADLPLYRKRKPFAGNETESETSLNVSSLSAPTEQSENEDISNSIQPASKVSRLEDNPAMKIVIAKSPAPSKNVTSVPSVAPVKLILLNTTQSGKQQDLTSISTGAVKVVQAANLNDTSLLGVLGALNMKFLPIPAKSADMQPKVNIKHTPVSDNSNAAKQNTETGHDAVDTASSDDEVSVGEQLEYEEDTEDNNTALFTLEDYVVEEYNDDDQNTPVELSPCLTTPTKATPITTDIKPQVVNVVITETREFSIAIPKTENIGGKNKCDQSENGKNKESMTTTKGNSVFANVKLAKSLPTSSEQSANKKHGVSSVMTELEDNRQIEIGAQENVGLDSSFVIEEEVEVSSSASTEVKTENTFIKTEKVKSNNVPECAEKQTDSTLLDIQMKAAAKIGDTHNTAGEIVLRMPPLLEENLQEIIDKKPQTHTEAVREDNNISNENEVILAPESNQPTYETSLNMSTGDSLKNNKNINNIPGTKLFIREPSKRDALERSLRRNATVSDYVYSEKSNAYSLVYEGDSQAPTNDISKSSRTEAVQEGTEDTCGVCLQSFSGLKEVMEHLKKHLLMAGHKCPVHGCKVLVDKAHELVMHMKVVHRMFNVKVKDTDEEKEIDKDIDIETANKALRQLLELQGNLETVVHRHGNQTKVLHVCPVCARTFPLSYLKLHIRSHTGERPHECKKCNKGFRTADQLHKHVQSHSGARNYKCGECHKLFKRISHVREHLKVHSNVRRYPCSICDKTFKSANACKVHMRTHVDVLPHKCGFCQKSFREKCALDRHVRTHTGEKPFTCKYCGRGFAEHGTLNRHLKAKIPCHNVSTFHNYSNKKAKMETDIKLLHKYVDEYTAKKWHQTLAGTRHNHTKPARSRGFASSSLVAENEQDSELVLTERVNPHGNVVEVDDVAFDESVSEISTEQQGSDSHAEFIVVGEENGMTTLLNHKTGETLHIPSCDLEEESQEITNENSFEESTVSSLEQSVVELKGANV